VPSPTSPFSSTSTPPAPSPPSWASLRIRGAWTLGVLVAAPSAVLYLIAGTRGLPDVHLRTLTSTGGMLCLAAEILYTALWVSVARRDLGL
jgi:hypothetical protein